VTPPGPFVPVQSSSWKCKILMAPVAALPMAFGDELSRLSSTHVAPASIPASRRRHCPGLPTDVADMSIRFMNAGQDRLVHTI
jgi:hypothetical protein